MKMDRLPKTRRDILFYMKWKKSAAISELSQHLKMSSEAIRQQLLQLEIDGLIERRMDQAGGRGPGRPSARYFLTVEGENLFPKRYESLSLDMMDAIEASLGREGLALVLASIAEYKVKAWKSKMDRMAEREKAEVLRNIYITNDDFLKVEIRDGTIHSIIEENCPYLEVALQRPVLCSVTVSVLMKLLGARVVRKERFQNGDGRCVFQVLHKDRVDPDGSGFAWETD